MKQMTITALILFLMAGIANATPVITQQPVGQQMVDVGQSVALTVGLASGTPSPSYQWWAYTYNDSTSAWSWSKISGATQASYSFSATVPTDSNLAETSIYQYYCVITNSSGSTTSSIATVMVNTAPVYAPLPTSPSYVLVQQNTGNDTAAIQAAVNQEAGTGGTVFIPSGTYMINTPGISLPNNITLRLDPGAILQATSTANFGILNIVNVANVNVIGGSLIGYGPTGSGVGINIEGSSNVVVEGVRSSALNTSFYLGASTSNPTNTNITLGSVLANNNGSQGISIVSANGVLINNSVFAHSYGAAFECGINVQPGSGDTVNNLQIINSSLIGNYAQGICVTPQSGSVTNMSINGNNFSGNFGGMILNNASAVTITNNTVNDSNVGGIYLNAGSTGNTITGNAITVSGTAIGNGIVDNSGNITNNIQSNTCNGSACSTNVPTVNYSYTLTVNQSGNGTVSENPNSATYAAGSQVILTATPATGYMFSGWSGGATGSTDPLTLAITANTSVTANFSLQTEAITASAGTGGVISPSGAVSVNYGTSQTFSVTPNSGYTASLTVDGVVVTLTNNSYTLSNVTAAHTITASFSLQTISSDGTILNAGSPGSLMTSAGTWTFSSILDSGNNEILLNGKQAADGSALLMLVYNQGNFYCENSLSRWYMWNGTGWNTLSGDPRGVQTKIITASAGTGGKINPSGSISVNSGASQTFTVTPNSGYTASLTVDGTAVALTNNSYTLSNVTAAHTVVASFTLVPPTTYTITANAGANGTISPSGSISVNSGTSQTFTVTPNSGYTASLTVDGTAVALTNNSYTLSNVTAAHTVVASFTLVPPTTYTITANAGANGTISPSGSISVNSGASQTFTVTPNSGYTASLTIDGTTVALTNNSYTLSNVTAAHTITASFSLQTISSDGTILNAGSPGSLMTSAGTWTFSSILDSGNNEILLNGKQAADGSALLMLVYNQGNLYCENSLSRWYMWNGSGWNTLSGDPRVAQKSTKSSKR